MTLSLTPARTLVTMLLDRSGSMHGIRDITINSCNEMIGQLQQSTADVRMSLVQFDAPHHGTADLVPSFVGTPVKDVRFLTREDYTPRGGTPLYDAIGMTIGAIEESVKERSNVKIVLVIQTDGQENESTKFSLNQVRSLIERKTADGWEFKFMGAGLEARSYHQSSGMGVRAMATMAYDRFDDNATRSAFADTGANIRAFAEGLSNSTDYTVEQKMRAGDREDEAVQKERAQQGAFVPSFKRSDFPSLPQTPAGVGVYNPNVNGFGQGGQDAVDMTIPVSIGQPNVPGYVDSTYFQEALKRAQKGQAVASPALPEPKHPPVIAFGLNVYGSEE